MVLQAFLQLVKMEQERADRERRVLEEERRKRMEEVKRVKRMLDAAFDGDNEEIGTLLKEASNKQVTIAI